MRPVHGYRPIYRLRYRLDFRDRKSKIGFWNRADTDITQQVWSAKKDGLTRVSIEGEKLGEWTVKTMLECDGHEFATMRWVVAASIGGWKIGKYKVPPRIIGLTIVTATQAATVFVDGTGKCEQLSEYEKSFPHTKEHSI
jgi:hypothetical protein